MRYKVDFGVIADALEGEDDEFFDSDDDFSTSTWFYWISGPRC